MPKFFGFFMSSQQQLKQIKRQQAQIQRQIEREVCALVSSGNVSLQQGDYITHADMDTIQAELEMYFSSEQSKW